MIDYGFRAVRTSLHAMNQAVTENQVQLMLSRAALRIINCVPPLKQRTFLCGTLFSQPTCYAA